MKRTLPVAASGPAIVRIPSAQARSGEGALERACDDTARRFDVWVHRFADVEPALALRRRLDEDRRTRTIALVAILSELDELPPAGAALQSRRAHDGGIAAVFPPSVEPTALDDVLLDLVERQRTVARHRGVRAERQAAAVEEERLHQLERSLARRLQGAIDSLSGADFAALGPLDEKLREFERLYVSRALAELHGDVAATRRMLRVTRSRFYRILQAHDLHSLVRRHEPGDGADDE